MTIDRRAEVKRTLTAIFTAVGCVLCFVMLVSMSVSVWLNDNASAMDKLMMLLLAGIGSCVLAVFWLITGELIKEDK